MGGNMLYDGDKHSSKRWIVLIFSIVLIISYLAEQFFKFEIDAAKFNSLATIVEFGLFAIASEKFKDVLSKK
jgi:hypothetical protein